MAARFNSQDVELRQLRYFVVLGHELHFGRAAERLNIAQPALSQQISALERRIGVQLLERSTRRVRITAAGEAFLAEAEDILTRLNDAIVTAQVRAGHQTGLLRVGALFSATFSLLPAVLQRFRSLNPDQHVEVGALQSRQIVTALEKGEIDVGFLRPPQEPGQLRLASLLDERFVAVMPDGHRLAGRKALYLKDLAGERLLQLKRDDLRGAFRDLEARFARERLQFDPGRVAATTFSALSLVASGAGITFVPEWVRSLPWHGVAIRDIEDLDARITLSVGWRGDDPRPAVEAFVETALRVIRSPEPQKKRPARDQRNPGAAERKGRPAASTVKR